ncbi:hypothetical protein JCM5350_004470 [Sporobolomyces pararoseus]
MWTDWIEALVTGKLLDISNLETLHLRNIHEFPESTVPWKLLRNMQTASNLKEISIWNHQGSSILWKAFLSKKCPSLKRLAISGITKWEREVMEWDSQGLDAYSLPDESPTFLGQDIPYTPSNFNLIVFDAKPDLSNLKKFSPEITLVNLTLDGTHSPTVFTKCQNFRLVKPLPVYNFQTYKTIEPKVEEMTPKLSGFLDELSKSLDQKTKKLKSVVKFLSIPSQLVHDSDIKEKVEIIRSKGVEVTVEDEEESSKSTSLFLPEFVDYLKRNGKLTRDEE